MITQINNYDLKAKKRILSQFQGKKNVEALVSSLISSPVQKLEDAIFTLQGLLDIDNSDGFMLDIIGKLVGRDRAGLDDDVYRIFIKGQIARNISAGTAENLISLWKIMTIGAVVRYINRFNATVDLMSNAELDTAIVNDAFALVQESAMAGVLINSIGVFDLTNPFGTQNTPSFVKGFTSSNSQGVATSTGGADELIDSGATFQTDLVTTDMIAVNITTEKFFNILSIDSEIQITVDLGGESSSFDINHTYYVGTNVGGKVSFLQSAATHPLSVLKDEFNWTNGSSDNVLEPTWNYENDGFRIQKENHRNLNWPYYIAAEWIKRVDKLNNYNTFMGTDVNARFTAIADTADITELTFDSNTTFYNNAFSQSNIGETVIFTDGMEIRVNNDGAFFSLTTAGRFRFDGNNVSDDTLLIIFAVSGTLTTAIEINGDNCTFQNLYVVNQGTGTITNAIVLNSGVKANHIRANVQNVGVGSITNAIVDNSGNSTNIKEVKVSP
jgi:hypothetical protein